MTRAARARAAAGALAVLLFALLFGAACSKRVTFDPAEIERHQMLANVPPGFLLGVATSAHQIEGGNHNDWTDWERGADADGTPHVVDGATTLRAADSWNLWEEDVDAVAALGANVYRLGLEWSRLEPAEGQWDQGAAARYRQMLTRLRGVRPRPVEPMLNLWHFTLPPWVVARGGWEWDGAPAAFAAFAARAADAYGDLVDWWCTLNEPNVYATKSYMGGQWPPGVRDPKRAARVVANLLRGHALAAAALRAHDRADADGDGAATRIGLAHNVIVFDPASAGPLDALVARYADRFYNRDIPDSIAAGRIKLSLPTVVSVDEAAPGLQGSLDWLGLNYYTRQVIAARIFGARGPNGAPYEVIADPSRPKSDLGWEIYPEGLYRILIDFRGYPWPLLVTENGIADRAGTTRPGYIRSHVFALDRARAEGVNVIGYMHWSLLDNFEWSHGYRGRFGLFAVDFAGDPGLARRPTPAVATFQEMARNAGLLTR